MLDRLTTAERFAIEHVADSIGVDAVGDAIDWMLDLVEEARDSGADDDEIGELFLGVAHDHRWRGEATYLMFRGILRVTLHATARDGVEAS